MIFKGKDLKQQLLSRLLNNSYDTSINFFMQMDVALNKHLRLSSEFTVFFKK